MPQRHNISRGAFLLFLTLILLTSGVAAEPGGGATPDPSVPIQGCPDVDGDGVARCCDLGRFFATYGANTQKIVAYMSNDDGTFTPSPTPMAAVSSGSIFLSAVGDFNNNQRWDVVWYETQSLERFVTECDQEWQTTGTGPWMYPGFYGGGLLDAADTFVDLVSWDMACCPMTGPAIGGPNPDLGLTASGDGLGGFTENYGDWDPSTVLNAWIGRRTYNQLDTGAGPGSLADLMFVEYSSGGASTTEVHLAAGDPSGTFQASVLVGTITSQPQNDGDTGDIDGDTCVDWVGGPDDDGDRGTVQHMLGDCLGGFGPASELVDVCDGCAGSGAGHGAGRSQLYDWDLDGDLDLLTGHTVDTNISGEILYWENDGTGNFLGPAAVASPPTQINSGFVSPLQDVEVTCPDIDGDGVARCCTPGPFFATYTPGFQGIDAYMSNGNGTFTRSPTAIAEISSGTLRWNSVGDFDHDGQFDILWYDTDTLDSFHTECHTEWITTPAGAWIYPGYNGGGDLDGDGFATDLVTWDMACCPMNGPALGPGPILGQSALSPAPFAFTELYGSWDPSVVINAWRALYPHNLQDVTSDGHADVLFVEYANGGASTTEVHLATGLGNGFFNPSTLVATIPGQPQNSGDMGDFDKNGTVDWVGGPDDDGDRGVVKAMLGNGSGGFSAPFNLVDACPTGCAGSGAGHGAGASQLYDWDLDGDLDLLTVHTVDTNVSATVQYWENQGGGSFPTSTVVVPPGDLEITAISSPLRRLEGKIPFFRDGFETGDTSQWSSTSQ